MAGIGRRANVNARAATSARLFAASSRRSIFRAPLEPEAAFGRNAVDAELAGHYGRCLQQSDPRSGATTMADAFSSMDRRTFLAGVSATALAPGVAGARSMHLGYVGSHSHPWRPQRVLSPLRDWANEEAG